MRVHFRHFRIVAILLVAACIISGCSLKKKNNRGVATPAPNDSIVVEKGRDFAGVIKAMDAKNKTITFYNPDYESDAMYPYTDATSTLTKNEKDIVISSLEIGAVYDVYLNESKSEIVKIQESSDIIAREDVDNIIIDDDAKNIDIDGVKYKYGSNFRAYSNGKPIEITEVTSWDRVTFRGVSGKAYSVVVTRGHGYVKPEKHKEFVGGTVTVDGVAILPVTEEMMIPVPEGEYKISMQNGDFEGEKTVAVKRDEVVKVDMSDVKKLVENTSHVIFKIEPEGAELYINGVEREYDEPVSMKYGKHNVRVKLEGYTEYTGIIDVKSPNPTIKINLAEEKTDVDDEGEVEPVSTAKADVYDPDASITVKAPEGVQVYMDGSYEGIAPCTFKKKVGKLTLTLTDDDSNTKSYNVTTLMDGEDVTFSFPDVE